MQKEDGDQQNKDWRSKLQHRGICCCGKFVCAYNKQEITCKENSSQKNLLIDSKMHMCGFHVYCNNAGCEDASCTCDYQRIPGDDFDKDPAKAPESSADGHFNDSAFLSGCCHFIPPSI